MSGSGHQPVFARLARVMAGTLALLLGLPAPDLRAEVVLSNLPNTVNGGSEVSDLDWKAMLFTTGPSPTQLASVVVGLNPATGVTPPSAPQVKVSLFSVAAANPAAELLTTGLVSVDMQATQGVCTFLDAIAFKLAANTPYALVVWSDASKIKWGRNVNNTPAPSDGFQYDTFLVSRNAGGSWSTTVDGSPINMDNALSISVVPKPGQMVLLAMAAAGSWCAFRGRLRRCD